MYKKNKIQKIKDKILIEYYLYYPRKIWINPMIPEFAVTIGESFILTQYAVSILLKQGYLERDKEQKNSYKLSFKALNYLRNKKND